MKAIILAAGRGKRLLPLTENIPKCLIELTGKTLLEHSLDRITNAGIQEIIIVVGFKEEMVRDRIGDSHNGAKVKYIVNEKYETTNNIYSLWLARGEIDTDVLIVNGDDIFHHKIIRNLVDSEHPDAAVIDTDSILDEDSMKVIIDNGLIKDIDKKILIETAHGDAIGIYKFSHDGAKLFFHEIQKFVNEGNLNVFYLRAMKELVKGFDLHLVPTGKLPWDEVDYPTDIERAEKTMKRIIEEEGNN
jgi:choline kinase